MAQPPVSEVQFEIVRGPRRIGRRAMWFGACFVAGWAAGAYNTASTWSLIVFAMLAAFTWPALNRYFPLVDQTRTPLDPKLRRPGTFEENLAYIPPARPAETFFTALGALLIATNIQPVDGDPTALRRSIAVLLAALLWPAACHIGEKVAARRDREGRHDEPAIQNWAMLVKVLAFIIGLVVIVLAASELKSRVQRSMTIQTPQTASTTVAP